MAHAARHPGMFGAAASYSGTLDTMAPGMPALMDAIVAREFLPPRSLWGSPVLNVLTWRDFNPRVRAEGLPAPRCTCPAAATCGVDDWLALLRIPVTTHYYAGGGHSWTYWKREFTASWPMLAGALGVPE